MKKTTVPATESSPRRWVALKSAWHWDLWVATLLGLLSLAILMLAELKLAWSVATPCLVTSFGVLTVTWRQSTALFQRLQDSHYGELVRTADRSEAQLFAPYNVVKWVSVAAVICAGLTAAILAASDIEYLHVSAVTAMLWLTSWSMLGLISLLMLDTEHKRNISLVQSQQERLDLAQRQYERNSGGTLSNT